jgi:hypothetical protein
LRAGRVLLSLAVTAKSVPNATINSLCGKSLLFSDLKRPAAIGPGLRPARSVVFARRFGAFEPPLPKRLGDGKL